MSKVIIDASTGAVTREALTAPEQARLTADAARLATVIAAESSRKARQRALLTSLASDATLADVIDKVNDIIKATRAQFYQEDAR